MDREAVGVGDRYSNIRSNSAPTIDKALIGKRLDICLQYFLDDGRADILCSQGEVILLSDGTNIPKKQCRQACFKADEDVMIRRDKNRERN